MPNSKLRLIAQTGPAIARSKDPGTVSVSCIDNGSSPSAEENLRLLKAFSRVDDARRRAWLLELVEHFAGLDPAAH